MNDFEIPNSPSSSPEAETFTLPQGEKLEDFLKKDGDIYHLTDSVYGNPLKQKKLCIEINTYLSRFYLRTTNLSLDEFALLKKALNIFHDLKLFQDVKIEIQEKELIDFLSRIYQNFFQEWARLEKFPMDQADWRSRQLYQLTGECHDYSTAVNDFCFSKISEIDTLTLEALKQGRVPVKSFLNERVAAIQKREAMTSRRFFMNARRNPDLDPYAFYEETMENNFGYSIGKGIVRKEKRKGRMVYLMDGGGEGWRLEIFFDPDLENIQVAVISDRDPNVFTVIPLKVEKGEENYNFLKNPQVFTQIIEKAKAQSREHENNRKLLKKYDIPSNQSSYCLRIIPQEYDMALEGFMQTSTVKMHLLQSRYPKMTIAPMLFSNSPKEDVKEKIKSQYEQGNRFFILEIFSHGDQEGLGNFKDFGLEDILALSREYPDAHFQINTIACFGAGFRPAFFKEQQEGETYPNVSFFLQTKPDTINIATLTESKNNEEDPRCRMFPPFVQPYQYSNYYGLYFMKALLRGKRYGAAADYADKKSRKLLFLDPEAIINGQLIGEQENDEDLEQGKLKKAA